ncbi:uncharacterized protein LOC142531984 [Primulina tabacum]|uniref:uncharacterized protein LOC142531984 n=1 Tax=Primulina tabacum TaxID=48773 RepID=UPI003F5AA350
MDKSWMFLPRQTKEYMKGLESFLDFAFSNANINGMIACLCAKCKIGICVSREDACDHLTVDGFIKGMASEGKTVGKPHFQYQDKANTQSRIMIANHAARSSKKVGLARELGSMNDSGKEIQNIQGMLNNQMDGVSKHQHNDLQDVDSESESLNAEKKTRGPTFMKEIWGRPSTLPRIKIRCDDMGRPIGSRRNKFTDFLGTLARNGKFCPIDVEDWHKMPLDSKKTMLGVIKEKYDLPPGTESWTLRSIATKWRNWKAELKKKYYDPELPMQVLLEERDKRAFVEQYVKLVAQWNSEKSKERSEKNKIARNQKIMNQTIGRRSFAQVQ